MSLPIQGNQYFNRVENVASSQIQRVLTDSVVTTNLTVSTGFNYGNLNSVTVVGYAAVQGTGGNGVGLSTSQTVAPTAGNANGVALVLPANAIVTKLVVESIGTTLAAGTSLVIASSATVAPGGGVPIATTPLLNGGTRANINSGLVWTQFGSTGSTVVGTQVFLNTVETGSFTAGGIFQVFVTYVTINS